MSDKYIKSATVRKYAAEIEELVMGIRKWITECEEHPSVCELRKRCEDVFFSSELSYAASTDELTLIVESMVQRVSSRYGVLAALLEDSSINEIMVNGPERIYVERNKRLERIDDSFTSDAELEETIRMFASDVHREVNEAHPIVDARLPSGYRVNGVLKAVALNGPILTIRKFREKEIEMSDLIEFGSISEECASDLRALVRSGYNMFISGGTSSGKTTFLNALSASIGENERVITIEDSAELVISHIENRV